MPNVLVIHAGKHGHTAKIAARIAAAMGERAVVVTERKVSEAGDLSPSDYDAVVVGGSIHAGHHDADLVEWARRHATTLTQLPSAFFSVCLAAADDTEESREATRRYLEEFEEQTGWTPRKRTTFAGALQYLEYDFVTRLLMRVLMHRGHHPTDTSRDFDYTDWEAVDRFAAECAELAHVAC
jgi:menaquinone-dependent protoporphyrinogen oxidase